MVLEPTNVPGTPRAKVVVRPNGLKPLKPKKPNGLKTLAPLNVAVPVRLPTESNSPRTATIWLPRARSWCIEMNSSEA